VSLEDIVVIERALTRRMLEYVEKDQPDVEDFEKRIKVMEELEAQQWIDREKVHFYFGCMLAFLQSENSC